MSGTVIREESKIFPDPCSHFEKEIKFYFLWEVQEDFLSLKNVE